MGFRRNLSAGEIVEQVLVFARDLSIAGDQLTNVVIMGMGEPFHNYAQTMESIQRLNDPDGFNFGQRRITISTVGLVPMIKKFARDNQQVNLAVSLHAADEDLRSSMLPINRKYPLSDLIPACKEYVQLTHRRITFEWALINNVNDTEEQAQKLVGLIRGIRCHVNVIPLNHTKGYAGEATTHSRAQAFQAVLENAGIPCTIRVRRGIDIQAGCGQLAIKNEQVD
jgi:23S rRNA (adenine2503-C2)-methyltransferase